MNIPVMPARSRSGAPGKNMPLYVLYIIIYKGTGTEMTGHSKLFINFAL